MSKERDILEGSGLNSMTEACQYAAEVDALQGDHLVRKGDGEACVTCQYDAVGVDFCWSCSRNPEPREDNYKKKEN